MKKYKVIKECKCMYNSYVNDYIVQEKCEKDCLDKILNVNDIVYILSNIETVKGNFVRVKAEKDSKLYDILEENVIEVNITSKIRTIRKINIGVKYVEFWFEEERNVYYSDYEKCDIDTWITSCKCGNFFYILEECNLLNNFYNYGAVGLKTEWELLSNNMNYGLVKIFKE